MYESESVPSATQWGNIGLEQKASAGDAKEAPETASAERSVIVHLRIGEDNLIGVLVRGWPAAGWPERFSFSHILKVPAHFLQETLKRLLEERG